MSGRERSAKTESWNVRTYRALEVIARSYPMPVPKDDVYREIVEAFGVRRATVIEDVETLVLLDWLKWSDSHPGHLVFGSDAPITVRVRKEAGT